MAAQQRFDVRVSSSAPHVIWSDRENEIVELREINPAARYAISQISDTFPFGQVARVAINEDCGLLLHESFPRFIPQPTQVILPWCTRFTPPYWMNEDMDMAVFQMTG